MAFNLNTELLDEDSVKLIISLLTGALLGAEREYHSKPAGFRTIILICVSSTLFTILSFNIGDAASHDRIAANILTGIGFLGAGAIFKNEDHVVGLTTAVTIWAVSAIGMAIGAGYYNLAFIVTSTVLVVLIFFSKLGDFIERRNKVRTYDITIMNKDYEGLSEIEAAFKSAGLKYKNTRLHLTPGRLSGTWEVGGNPSGHASLIQNLSQNPNILTVNI